MSKRVCQHWWRVPAAHLGPDAVSKCKYCGARRKFPRTMPPQKWCPRLKAWSGQVTDLQERLRAAENAQ